MVKQEETLYYSVYCSVITDIYCGKWKKGDTFQSLQELCDQYGIGRNTARTVVTMLEEKGYISRQGKRVPEICFDWDDVSKRERYLEEIAQRKEAVGEVYDLLIVTMPQLFTGIIEMLPDRETEYISQILENYAETLQIKDEREMAQELCRIYVYVLSLLHNRLLENLFQSLFQFIQLPLETKDRTDIRFRAAGKYIKYSIKRMANAVRNRDEQRLKKLIAFYCRNMKTSSDKYLKRICKGIETGEKENFIWRPKSKANTEYLFLAVHILQKISSGFYVENEILPSYAKLAMMYDVSEKTARKAVEVLNDWSVITTVNGLGSRVNLFDENKGRELMEEPFLQELREEYFMALQIFDLICKPFAVYLAEISPDKRKARDYLTKEETGVINNIYRQLEKMLKWKELLEACGLVKSSFLVDSKNKKR